MCRRSVVVGAEALHEYNFSNAQNQPRHWLISAVRSNTKKRIAIKWHGITSLLIWPAVAAPKFPKQK
jgi:hypothetical protein